MKALFITFVMAVALTGCTNNSSISGVNNNDTVELKDEFGRDAYPEVKVDSAKIDSIK